MENKNSFQETIGMYGGNDEEPEVVAEEEEEEEEEEVDVEENKDEEYPESEIDIGEIYGENIEDDDKENKFLQPINFQNNAFKVLAVFSGLVATFLIFSGARQYRKERKNILNMQILFGLMFMVVFALSIYYDVDYSKKNHQPKENKQIESMRASQRNKNTPAFRPHRNNTNQRRPQGDFPLLPQNRSNNNIPLKNLPNQTPFPQQNRNAYYYKDTPERRKQSAGIDPSEQPFQRARYDRERQHIPSQVLPATKTPNASLYGISDKDPQAMRKFMGDLNGEVRQPQVQRQPYMPLGQYPRMEHKVDAMENTFGVASQPDRLAHTGGSRPTMNRSDFGGVQYSSSQDPSFVNEEMEKLQHPFLAQYFESNDKMWQENKRREKMSQQLGSVNSSEEAERLKEERERSLNEIHNRFKPGEGAIQPIYENPPHVPAENISEMLTKSAGYMGHA